MDGEQEAIAPVEAETPIEAADETTNLQVPEPETPEVQEPEAVTEPEDEFEEFEWSGRQIKGPKGLKDSVLMHADYTRKTQEVSERRKELEAREQQLSQQAKANDEEMAARVTIRNIEDRLKPYADLTEQQWLQWEQEDPLAANQGFRTYQMLKSQYGEAKSTLDQKQNERAEQAKS
jgi:hypothetical protein